MAKGNTANQKKNVLKQLTDIKGIGPKLAEAIWEKYRLNSISHLVNNPEETANSIKGLSNTLTERVVEAYSDQINSPRLLSPKEVKEYLKMNWEELFKQRRAVESVFERVKLDLLQRPHIQGLHVGLRRKSGQVVYPMEYAIRIHVENKWSEGHPRLMDLLPKEIDGVKVDVLERSYRVSTGETDPVSRYVEPLKGGIPIVASTSDPKDYGTLGALVFSGGTTRYITNRHVAGSVGVEVHQPPNRVTPDGKDSLIGTVIDSERNGDFDCAIVAPSGNRQSVLSIEGLDSDSLFAVGKLTVVDEHITEAFKIGASTGFEPLRVGIVKNVNTPIKIDGINMTGQIIVESENDEQIIAGGDSGSLLLVESARENFFFVVGLVHAETKNQTALVATHFDVIMNRFGVNVSIF